MSDWELRQLCPDGTCLGVIRADGTCSVCGHAMPGWGDERNRGLLVDPEDAADAGPAEDEDAADDDAPDAPAAEAEADADDDDAPADEVAGDEGAADPTWSARELCPDEACIGVLGADRRCKVCGKADTGN
jgi:hypothetical protein